MLPPAVLRGQLRPISRAKRPIILAGNGVTRTKASVALIHIAERLDIPVANTFMGKGIMPYTHPLSLWTIGLKQRDYVNRIIENSDLVIAVGYDLIEYDPKKWNSKDAIEIIHISEEKADVNKCYTPLVEVIGDISDSLYEIARHSIRQDEPQLCTRNKKEIS